MASDKLDENGLSLMSYNEIKAEREAEYKRIYGDDIDLGSHTADGQLVNIRCQQEADLREVIRDVYNSCNPDFCRGIVQDVRFKINNIARKGGTFTIVPITLKVSSTVSLQGLDADYNDVNASAYGGTDDSGNKYFLIDSVSLTPGTHTVPFRAQNIGNVQPIIGTIVNPIQIIVGVDSMINNSAPTSVGINQETDEAFALRRERSTETRSQNNIDGMKAQLLNLDGVTDAYVYSHDYQNYPDSVDEDGIPIGYIWPIVEGGSNTDISVVLYANCGAAGLKGEVEVDTVTASGSVFHTKFDRSEAHPLYIRFDLQETVKHTNFDFDGIKQYIAENLIYKIYEYAETSKPTEVARLAIEANGGSGVPANLEISTDGEVWKDFIQPVSKKAIFTIDTSRIQITEIDL